jgi:dihydropteroate synthase
VTPDLLVGDTSLSFGTVTHVMGVINVSPESKNLHTVAATVDEAVSLADRYRSWGATVIDLGGQSSHFENETIDPVDEISRVVPVIDALVTDGHIVAIDTWKPEVADAALNAGAHIVNDTGGLKDAEMREIIARYGSAAIAVYVEGSNPHDVGAVEISDEKAKATARGFEALLAELAEHAITKVIVDPGIALNYRGDYEAYTRMQLEVIADTRLFKELGRPVLIPIPRKRDFHRMIAYMALALEHEADLIRVHDVAVACDLARLFGRAASLP